jgi:hypothetical protein
VSDDCTWKAAAVPHSLHRPPYCTSSDTIDAVSS